MNLEPIVSICIPSYNSEAYIAQTIESVQAQTYPHWNLHISDDGSSDATPSIIKAFAAKDSRISYTLHSPKIGIEENWNYALSMANGLYTKMMGADDILLPHCIERQISIFQQDKTKSIALVSAQSYIINSFGEKLFLRKSFLSPGKHEGAKVLQKCFFLGTNLIGEPHVGLFPTALRQKHTYNCQNIYMLDLDFWAKLLQHGGLFVCNEPLVMFRISPLSLTSKTKQTQAASFFRFAKKIYKEKHFPLPYPLLLWSFFAANLTQIVRNIVLRKS